MATPSRPNLQRFLDRLNGRSILTSEEQQAVLDLPGQAEQVHANHDFVGLGERVDHAWPDGGRHRRPLRPEW